MILFTHKDFISKRYAHTPEDSAKFWCCESPLKEKFENNYNIYCRNDTEFTDIYMDIRCPLAFHIADKIIVLDLDLTDAQNIVDNNKILPKEVLIKFLQIIDFSEFMRENSYSNLYPDSANYLIQQENNIKTLYFIDSIELKKEIHGCIDYEDYSEVIHYDHDYLKNLASSFIDSSYIQANLPVNNKPIEKKVHKI